MQLWKWGYLREVTHRSLDPDWEYHTVPRPYKARDLTGAIRRPRGESDAPWQLKRRRNEDALVYYQEGVEHQAWLVATKKQAEAVKRAAAKAEAKAEAKAKAEEERTGGRGGWDGR